MAAPKLRNGQEPDHFTCACSRRELLTRAGSGFGGLAMTWMLLQESMRSGVAHASTMPPGKIANPMAPKAPMIAPKVKNVIFLFMYGGPSQVDTFDYKPELTKHHGQQISGKGEIKTFGGEVGPLMKSPFEFKQHGKSGMWVSDVFPHLAKCVDDIAFVKSMNAKSNNHAPALFEMNTGSILQGHPSLGSWVTYGLGSENQNLPGFVVMTDHRGGPIGGAPNWSSGFMPATYQGTVFRGSGNPILDLNPAMEMPTERQRARLDLLAKLNDDHLQANPGDSELEARIASYELAYRMQQTAPEVVDFSKESAATQELYGLNNPDTEKYGRKCLLARRLVERGVRFVQVYSGGGHGDDTWDAHGDIVGNHTKHCGNTDLPIAGLLTDLKQRGLLDETLVVWGGEFGRMPMSQGGRGRDHNPNGFTVWMAGGGVKGGVSVGETDEVGYEAAVDVYTIHDLHATILHLLGLNDMQLTYLYNGRFQRLTENGGNLIKGILT